MSEKSKLEKLESELALAEKGSKTDAVKNNPKLLESVTKRISILTGLIESEKKSPSKTPAKTVAVAKAGAGKAKAEPKKEAKKSEPKAEKKVAKGKFELGDNVKFFFKKLQKEVTGEIIGQHNTKGTYTVKHKHGTSYPKMDKVEKA